MKCYDKFKMMDLLLSLSAFSVKPFAKCSLSADQNLDWSNSSSGKIYQLKQFITDWKGKEENQGW
jgi:hypothetical protein